MPITPLVGPVIGGLVNSLFTEDSITNLERLQTLFADSGATEGGAWNFADQSKVFQDIFATVPVTTSGDVVGICLDDSGLDNPVGQSTAADKPQWVENEGIKVIDGGDLMTLVAGATFTDFTVVAYVEDSGNALEFAWQHILNTNNRAALRKVTPDWQAYSIQAGVTGNATIKTSPTSGTVNVLVYKYDSSETAGEVIGQFNDETAVTANRTGTPTWGTTMDICGNGTSNGYTAPIHRVIFMNKILSGADLELAKTLVQNGW